MKPRMLIRFLYDDGKVNTLLVWPDGDWKVELFACMEIAQEFARVNNMEVIQNARNTSPKCE